MKLSNYMFFMVFFTFSFLGYGQNTVVTANSYDISDNLDLRAVASIFGESRDLSDFEYRLNDPNLRINNLDLNGDGYVDYLRVIEVVEDYTHLVVVQAVLGRNMFQDIATIEVEKNRRKDRVNVQIVGNSYLYGPNYIYEPAYVVTPPVFSLFWGVSYSPYYSSWSWNSYPSYYSYYRPYPTATYVVNIHNHVNYNNQYRYTSNRYSSRTPYMYNDTRQDYYERQYPSNSFSSRYQGYDNRNDLTNSRSSYSSSTNTGRSSYSNNNSGRSSYSTSGRTVNAVDNTYSGSRSSYSNSSNSGYSTGGTSTPSTGSSSSSSRSSYSSPNTSNNSSYNQSTGSSRSSYSSGSSYPSSSNSGSSSRSSYSSGSSYPSSSNSGSSSRSSYSSGSSYPSSSNSGSSSSRSSYSSGSSSSGGSSRSSSSSSGRSSY